MTKQELEDLIRYHNDLYTNGTAEISDAEYDELIEQLKAIDSDSSVLLEVGAIASYGQKVKHEIPMGSLNKCKTLEDLNKWEKSVNTTDLVWSEKIDGCSGELIFENGKLIEASTRGNGVEGSLITDNILKTDILKKIKAKDRLVLRGEFYIPLSHFNKHFKDKAANARNFVSGSIQLKSADDIIGRGVQFKVFRILNSKISNISLELLLAKQLGFDVVELHKGPLTEKTINEYQDGKRASLDYDIDGLVIQVNDNKKRESLGMNGLNSKGAIAFKFKPETVTTKVLSIEWNLGRSGRVTPVANLQPVSLMGSTVSRATLHNHSEMSRLNISTGCEVLLVKNGDIIPGILKTTKTTSKQEVIPTKCPCCGSELENDGVNLFCRNDNCGDKLLGALNHYLKVFDTKEIGESFLQVLIDNKLVKSIPDLYKVTSKDLIGKEGIGKKTIETYKKVIDSIREVPLDLFIRSLGMDSIGKTLSKDFAKKFNSIDKVFNVTKTELLSMEGIAEVSANKILDELKKKTILKDELLKYVTIANLKIIINGKFIGKKFAFTGECNMKRKEMEKIITDNGGEVASPSKSTSYIIIGEGAVQAKVDKVKSGGGKAITETEFLNL